VIAGRLRALRIILEGKMEGLATVTIDRDGEPVIINESDFDQKTMTLFGEKPAAKPKAQRKQKAES
jgi:hypothetical protein